MIAWAVYRKEATRTAGGSTGARAEIFCLVLSTSDWHSWFDLLNKKIVQSWLLKVGKNSAIPKMFLLLICSFWSQIERKNFNSWYLLQTIFLRCNFFIVLLKKLTHSKGGFHSNKNNMIYNANNVPEKESAVADCMIALKSNFLGYKYSFWVTNVSTLCSIHTSVGKRVGDLCGQCPGEWKCKSNKNDTNEINTSD